MFLTDLYTLIHKKKDIYINKQTLLVLVTMVGAHFMVLSLDLTVMVILNPTIPSEIRLY